MKANTKVLALMALLAAGVAGAEGTPVDTEIKNIATATFNDPTNNNAPSSIDSNPVTTKVLPKPDFDVVYSGNTPADGTTIDTSPAPTYNTTVVPGQQMVFPYDIMNNGNTVQNITLTTNEAGTIANTLVTPTYYEDKGVIGVYEPGTDTPISGPVSVPYDNPATTTVDEGIVHILQVYTVPADAAVTPGSTYGATPVGTGEVFNAGTISTKPEADTDLQWNKVTVYDPSGLVGPSGFPNAGATGTYTDPADNTTTITMSGDTQTAAPKAGDTTVTFINTLSNPGALEDGYVLQQPAGLPSGVTVTYLLPNGTAFSTTPVTLNGVTYVLENGLPTIKNVAPNSTENASFQTVVTYPATQTGSVSVAVPIDSINDTDTTADDTTTNVINTASVLFGNQSSTSTDPVPGDNNDTVRSPDAPGTTVNIPMEIKNTGGATDTFNVSADPVTFTVVNPDGTPSTVTVPVVYLPDANCDGTPDSTTAVTQPIVVGAGSATCIVATVAVPANAIPQTTNNLQQTVTSTTTGATAKDTIDTITVPPANLGKGVTVAKTVAGADTNTALPGADLNYQIIAKNEYSAPACNFKVTEANGTTTKGVVNTFTYTTFKSVTASASPTASIIYSFNGGAWQTSSTPTIALNTVTKVEVAIDSSGNRDFGTDDCIGANQTLTIDFVTTIK
ncbi:hypothetical protein ACINK0_04255 [Deinococcus sp. VB343]|uniref:hypothetical protein n=1 Tax=Deinococcus sp. VB343 TaxID=3385567 RepID=UPI0039C9622A